TAFVVPLPLPFPQVPPAIMTDGERRQPLQPLASDEVRVPIASVQAAQPGEEEEEDAASGSKSLQGSVASGASSAREREAGAGAGRSRRGASPLPGSGSHRLLLPQADFAAAELVPQTGL
uniref:Uncharacterized protein n=1 Tax=Monodelphis domestica TaxID=13616 RepID=F6VN26_MONDO